MFKTKAIEHDFDPQKCVFNLKNLDGRQTYLLIL